MTQPRFSTLYLGLSSLLILTLCGLMFHALYSHISAQPVLAEKTLLARNLELTDLCLFTEASYTRHLSQTDLATAFQDSPSTFEHFPSGTLVSPAAHLTGHSAGLIITRNHVHRN